MGANILREHCDGIGARRGNVGSKGVIGDKEEGEGEGEGEGEQTTHTTLPPL